MTTTKQGSKSKRSPTTDRRTKRIAELLNSGSELDLDALDQEGREIVETIARLGRKSNSGDSVYRSALEGSATACVHVDRDLVVTYVNPATVRLIAAVREDLEKAFPKADFDNLLGTCIDNFHLKPEVQRRLLDDPRNLPHKAEIKIGRLRIELNITALHDSNGEYLGARLEWYDVTDVRAKEAENAAYEAQVRAINRSLAVIEFEMDGTIRTANQNFLTAMGYTLEEVKGRHHSIFVDAQEAAGAGYREFWEKLNRGEFASSMYRRFGKGNREVWIQATYNPSIGADGKPFRVIKYATDVTAAQMKNADYEGQIAAIGKSQAVIEFEMDGTIRTANQNFLATLGYTLEEVRGKHHRMFMDPESARTAEYREFWNALARGEYQAGEFKRLGSGGREIYIQASYNPILDPNGKPFKVVKFASDITDKKLAELQQQRATEAVGYVIDAARERNLTRRGETAEVSGEYRSLVEGVNQLVDILEETLSQVETVTSEVSSASQEISQGSEKLANGASTQASSIEEISASLEEMSSMTTQNAEHASQAKNLAIAAKESANKGDGQMVKMKSAIDAIKASSDETAKIVKTIDEISFQTNMLALNAAVEAARAGDAGKGFAVVAEEVRSLAQRSAEAAKNTAQLIEDSAKNVDNGVALTSEVQSILGEITDGANKVTDLITEIAAASREQADGIGQVNSAVDQLNRVTQDNAASSEQSSAAANELNSQVQQLMDLLSQFQMTRQDGGRQRQQQRAPARAEAPRRPRPEAPPKGRGRSASQVLPLDDDDLADF